MDACWDSHTSAVDYNLLLPSAGHHVPRGYPSLDSVSFGPYRLLDSNFLDIGVPPQSPVRNGCTFYHLGLSHTSASQPGFNHTSPAVLIPAINRKLETGKQFRENEVQYAADDSDGGFWRT